MFVVIRDPATAPAGWINKVTVVYTDQGEAEAEAERLCRTTGSRFLVCVALKAVGPTAAPVEWQVLV